MQGEHEYANSLIEALLTLRGCTNITTLDENSVVTVGREFIFISLFTDPETDAIVAETTSFGYVASPVGISMGYGNHSEALLPETCRVVLWIKNKSELEEFELWMGNDGASAPS